MFIFTEKKRTDGIDDVSDRYNFGFRIDASDYMSLVENETFDGSFKFSPPSPSISNHSSRSSEYEKIKGKLNEINDNDLDGNLFSVSTMHDSDKKYMDLKCMQEELPDFL